MSLEFHALQVTQDPTLLLREVFQLQRAAVDRQPVPTLGQRLARLALLRQMVCSHRHRFQTALASDFGSHHPWMSDMLETGAVVTRVRHVEDNLAHWLTTRNVPLEPAHGSAHAEMIQMPQGVNGVMSPWNLPISCALLMVADILAAGNTAIIKPSEVAPATAQALDDAISSTFDPAVLAVAQGDADMAMAFAAMPWDHLTFTGSARTGRQIAQVAARAMVPVTLELGGKNPAVFLPDGVTRTLVERFLSFRTLKAGQVCTSPDYVLVPRDHMEDWIQLACASWREAYPAWVGHRDATGLINDDHYRRVQGYLTEAVDRNVRVVPLNDDLPDPRRRQLPVTLVVDPPDDLACMTEEILGPVIPVVPYDTFEGAIARINAGPSPLASYVAGYHEKLNGLFVTRVRSGGAGVNTFCLQGGHPALAIGGVGASGIGRHGGREGFLNYSYTKSVFHGAEDSIVHLAVSAPLSPLCGQVVDAMFRPDKDR